MQRQQLKHYSQYEITDYRAIKLLRDLRIYTHVPALKPLRKQMILLASHMAARKRFVRTALFNQDARERYMDILTRFYKLIRYDECQQLRTFLREYKYIDTDVLILSRSPY